jgi:type VI secretion system protein ImpK
MSLHDNSKLSLLRKVSVPEPPPVVPPPPPPAAAPNRITQMQRICAALAPEVAAQKTSVEQTANQITVRVGNVLLFDSASATVLDQFRPVAARVVATLDKEEGYIKIIGHTDDTPIRGNVRFPSNYQLSIERAKSVANLFKNVLTKPDRLQIDGKGEPAPIPHNKPADARARNRRVEIVIPRTDTGPVSQRTCPR